MNGSEPMASFGLAAAVGLRPAAAALFVMTSDSASSSSDGRHNVSNVTASFYYNWSVTAAADASNPWENDTGWLELDYYANDTANDYAATAGNGSSNSTGSGDGSGVVGDVDTIVTVLIAVVLGILILTTVIGNVFVIAAILLERNLQNVANFLILSLAVADLMVACLVMPLGAVYEVSKEWVLGPELCDMWTSSDVLCCTASILHLVAIAVDRFWAVTNVDYIHQRNSSRIGTMIMTVWVVALVVSIAPVLGWKDPGFHARIQEKRQCLISQDIHYQLFATMSTFYVPLIVILVLYWRIFQAARRRIRRKVKHFDGGGGGPTSKPRACSETTTTFTSVATIAAIGGNAAHVSPEKSSSANGSASQTSDLSRLEMLLPVAPQQQPATVAAVKKVTKTPTIKETAESKREKKAAKTLAIITGAFVVCWLPFFVVALLMPIFGERHFNEHMTSFFLWLGYFNSTLNPIIYTIFSPEFRCAFRRILFGRRAGAGYRSKR